MSGIELVAERPVPGTRAPTTSRATSARGSPTASGHRDADARPGR